MPFAGGEECQLIEGACSPTRLPSRGSKRPVALGYCSPSFAGKYWQICKWTVLARILAAAVSLTVAFGVQAAGAQTPPLPQPTLQQPAAQSANLPPGYCKQWPLTGPLFLNLVNTITEHGDLTDIAFLQKVLGTKLSLSQISYGSGANGSTAPHILYYTSNNVVGSPITVTVQIFKGNYTPETSGEISAVRFGSNYQAAFINCLNLTTENFVSTFGRETGGWLSPSPGGEETIGLKKSSKNGTAIEVQFEYTYDLPGRPLPPHELVFGVSIKEYK
jgi:hypothetical protein